MWKRRRKQDRRITFSVALAVVTVGLLFLGVAWRIDVVRLVEAMELRVYDARMGLTLVDSPLKPSPDIAILVFDDPTLYLYEEEYGSWPWPRDVHADIIEFLNRKAPPKLIAYDLLFVASKRSEKAEDQRFIDAFLKHKNVLLAMNFDNYLDQTLAFGKGLNPKDYELIQPMALKLENRLSVADKPPAAAVGEDGFYANPSITFNHFRPLLRQLYQAPERLYLINHARDEDGVSRTNPLVFRFQYQSKKNAPIESGYYPHISVRLLEWLQRQQAIEKGEPWVPPQYTLLPSGELQMGDQRIPLSRNGLLNVWWYNYNVDQAQLQRILKQQAYPQREQLAQLYAKQPTEANKVALQQLQRNIVLTEKRLQQAFVPKPYPMISVASVLQALRHEKAGQWTLEDQRVMESLRNKIVFVGTTAVSSFDMKTIPTSRVMPGIVQQAVTFDNLYQNKGYLKRLSPQQNQWMGWALALLAASVVFWIRSAWLGLGAVMVMMLLFLVSNVLLYKLAMLWVNIVGPIVGMTLAASAAYLMKYVGRDRDFQQTYKLATTDGLTGLFNHRFFQEFMGQCLAASQRSSQPFSLLLVDIDFFKKFNDSYGHQAGDLVLRGVARRLQQAVRADDLVARYGGEEMAIVLPETDYATAMDVAAKLVQRIADESFDIGVEEPKTVTISVGVATYPADGDKPSQLIAVADEGLYEAKKAGRNRVGQSPSRNISTVVDVTLVTAAPPVSSIARY